MLVPCGLTCAEGSGFSVLPQSGQANALALANAVCLVFGFLQTQYSSDIPWWFSQWCYFVLGLLNPSILASGFVVAKASLC